MLEPVSHVPIPIVFAVASINLTSWQSSAAYFGTLNQSPNFQNYMNHTPRKDGIPGFFIDACDVFISSGDQVTALKVLSNLAELELENPQLYENKIIMRC